MRVLSPGRSYTWDDFGRKGFVGSDAGVTVAIYRQLHRKELVLVAPLSLVDGAPYCKYAWPVGPVPVLYRITSGPILGALCKASIEAAYRTVERPEALVSPPAGGLVGAFSAPKDSRTQKGLASA